jgi:hypothetical protein
MVWCFWERGAVLCRNKECWIRGEEEEHRRTCRKERDDGRRGEIKIERIGRDEDGKIEREEKREENSDGKRKWGSGETWCAGRRTKLPLQSACEGDACVIGRKLLNVLDIFLDFVDAPGYW